MYQDTVTVFNQLKIKKDISWYPTVIRGVELQITAGRNRNATGLESADSAKIFIRYSNTDEKMMVAISETEEKQYLKPKAWSAYTEKDKAFTFHEGEDFFIQGEYPEEIIKDSDYEDGFLSYMSERYDDLFMVNKADVYKTIPHLEIGGK